MPAHPAAQQLPASRLVDHPNHQLAEAPDGTYVHAAPPSRRVLSFAPVVVAIAVALEPQRTGLDLVLPRKEQRSGHP